MKKIISVLLVIMMAAMLVPFSVSAEGTVIFVSSDGAGDGSSDTAALSSLTNAFAVCDGGGTIVVCGSTTIDRCAPAVYSGKVYVTSVYNGVDYRTTNDAKLCFSANFGLFLAGNTEFDNVVFEVASDSNQLLVACNSNRVVMGEGVTCTKTNDSYAPLGITIGSYSKTSTFCDETVGGNLTVNGGTWALVRCGNRSSSSPAVASDVYFTMNGGSISAITGSGNIGVNGNVYITINGGTVGSSASANLFVTDGAQVAKAGNTATTVFTVNGGIIKGNIVGSETGVTTGDIYINITGGDFTGCASIGAGTSDKVTLTYASSAITDAAIISTASFKAVNIDSAAPVTAPAVPADTTPAPVDKPVTTAAPAGETTAPAETSAPFTADTTVIVLSAAAFALALAVVFMFKKKVND